MNAINELIAEHEAVKLTLKMLKKIGQDRIRKNRRR